MDVNDSTAYPDHPRGYCNKHEMMNGASNFCHAGNTVDGEGNMVRERHQPERNLVHCLPPPLSDAQKKSGAMDMSCMYIKLRRRRQHIFPCNDKESRVRCETPKTFSSLCLFLTDFFDAVDQPSPPGQSPAAPFPLPATVYRGQSWKGLLICPLGSSPEMGRHATTTTPPKSPEVASQYQCT